MTQAKLKIVGLHVEGLKSIKRLSLPEDGMGWDGDFPDVVLIGGVNGSGKTSLFEYIFSMVGAMAHDWDFGIIDKLSRAWIDFEITGLVEQTEVVRILTGYKDSEGENRKDNKIILSDKDNILRLNASGGPLIGEIIEIFTKGTKSLQETDIPACILIPSEGRSASTFDVKYKSAGRIQSPMRLRYRWSLSKKWTDSFEAILYNARWLDLNAKEEGRNDEAGLFDTYKKEFERFSDGKKSLAWENGELVIKLHDGSFHSLDQLSSGEKQIILFISELRFRWRPGSLVLIDEPELHLHPAWQTKLYEALVALQKERGGQLILATQSNHLFGIAEPGTKLLLGGEEL
jgi:AAA15 family ATPase/GTPase